MKRDMNTIFRRALVAVVAGVALSAMPLLTACGDDDPVYSSTADAITIVQNDLIFPAEGRTATLQVSAAGPVEASVSDTWCTASVSGNVIQVTAEPNPQFSGRTAILTLRSGQYSRQLPIQQEGVVLDMPLTVNGHYSPLSGDAFTFELVHDLPLLAVSSQSWIHPVVDGNSVHVTVDGNQGGHIRRGEVVCTCGAYTDTLHIAQFDLLNDVVGTYLMMGLYGGTGGAATATRFEIHQRDGGLYMRWPQESFSDTYVPVTIDMTDCTVYLPGAFTLRDETRNYVRASFYDTEGTMPTNANVYAALRLYSYEDQGVNGAIPEYANWPGHQLDGFIIRQTTLVTTTLIQLATPVVTRIGPVGTTVSD